MNFDAVLIAGPTASGKSALAMELAERIGGTVVNADSMQVYAELRVLTARPSAADEARVPHRLYGHVPVAEHYSVGRYAADVAVLLKDVKRPIFTGGSGLYFNALTEGLSPIPAVPAETRTRVRARFAAQGASDFFAKLTADDPETAAGLRESDTHRVLRAAEVWEETGVGLRQWQREAGHPVLKDLHLARIVIAPPRETLVARIERRAKAMLEQGALEEVRALGAIDSALPASRALGLVALQAELEGRATAEEALTALVQDTRQYAKRQMTWFRQRMKDWIWSESGDLGNIISTIMYSNT